MESVNLAHVLSNSLGTALNLKFKLMPGGLISWPLPCIMSSDSYFFNFFLFQFFLLSISILILTFCIQCIELSMMQKDEQKKIKKNNKKERIKGIKTFSHLKF